MPVFLENPVHFSKEELRGALIGHQVLLPDGDPKKDEFLQLYLKHVSDPRPGDFCSKEDGLADLHVASLRENRAAHKMNVQDLSDNELKEQLIKHGAHPGPILPSTRSVYEKKLKQLLDQGPPVPQARQNGNGDMDRYSDSEEEGPGEIGVQQRRDVALGDVSQSSFFHHTTAPFTSPSEASNTSAECDSFSVTRMVERLEQRPSESLAGARQKMSGSASYNGYSVKDSLKADKNTMTYRTPTHTPFTQQNRFQGEDLLRSDALGDCHVSTPSALGMSATRRKPIKGAAGRPIQYKYDYLVAQAKLTEEVKPRVEKRLPRKLIPIYVQVAVFAIVAFLALVLLTMENNPDNPFHGEIQRPQ